MEEVVKLTLSINQMCVVRRKKEVFCSCCALCHSALGTRLAQDMSDRWPADNMLYRGTGFNEAHKVLSLLILALF